MKNYIVVTLSILLLVGILFAQVNVLPLGKQAIEDKYNKERLAGTQQPAPRNPDGPYPTVPAGRPLNAGVMGDCDGPFSSQDVHVVSCWQGTQNGVAINIYTGAQGAALDPQQGIVIIY